MITHKNTSALYAVQKITGIQTWNFIDMFLYDLDPDADFNSVDK